jgi:hypothetical protein
MLDGVNTRNVYVALRTAQSLLDLPELAKRAAGMLAALAGWLLICIKPRSLVIQSANGVRAV